MKAISGLAIFDLDGTLIDSFQQIGHSLNKTRREFGFPGLPPAYYLETVGLPIDYLITDLQLDGNMKEKFISEFRRDLLNDIRSGGTRIFKGVVSALEFFTQNNYTIAVATSKPTWLAKEVIKNSVLSNFNIHIQGTDDFPPKPNSEVIERVISQFPKGPAFMVGDRTEDVLASIGAGIPAIGIAASGHSSDLLYETGAILVFPSFNDFSIAIRKSEGFLPGFFHDGPMLDR